MTFSTPGLNIGVVGGGIVGLSAAVAMKRAGHKVEIFEKRSSQEQGTGITLAIAPNAGKVYQEWGFDLQAECGGVEASQVRHVQGATAKVIWRDDWKDFQEKYGSKVIFMRHGDLHAGLERLLLSTEGIPSKISRGCEITGVDCETGTIRLANGSSVKKDLIVIANGIHGKFLEEITGQDCPIQDTALSFFRFLLPENEVLDDPVAGQLFRGEPDEICFFPLFETGASIVTYLCEGGKTRAVNVFTKRLSEAAGDRGSRITRAQLLELAKGFHPNILAMLERAPSNAIFSYPLFTRDPVHKYTNGKAVIIGDAAHLMRPQQGQGGTIGVESAGCLGVLFENITSERIPSRLALFEKLRLGRCGPVHIFSNMMPTPDGYSWMLEKIKPFWDESRPLPPPGSKPLSLPFRDFIYGYDVLEDTNQRLEKSFSNTKEDLVKRVLPEGEI